MHIFWVADLNKIMNEDPEIHTAPTHVVDQIIMGVDPKGTGDHKDISTLGMHKVSRVIDGAYRGVEQGAFARPGAEDVNHRANQMSFDRKDLLAVVFRDHRNDRNVWMCL